MAALFLTSSTQFTEKFTQAENQIKILTAQMTLMETQIEDKKHENIVSRIMNAKILLDSCKPPLRNTDKINHILSNATKLATLEKKFDEAEMQLDSVSVYVKNCDFFTKPIENTNPAVSIEGLSAFTSFSGLVVASPPPNVTVTGEPIVTSETNLTAPALPLGILLLEVPNDITLYTEKGSGIKIFFSVIGYDSNDGRLSPLCMPTSGTEFHIGDTQVTCKIINSKNEVLIKSFKISIKQTIP
jgi:hypothetical protein